MSQFQTFGSGIKACLLTGMFAASVLAAPDAGAAVRMNLIGGTACKAASGPGADVFYFDSQFAQNVSASTQYLTCAIPEINPASTRAATAIEVLLRNPTGAAMEFTCVVQAGYSVYGVNNAVFTVNVAANSVGAIGATAASTPAIPARNSIYSPYQLSCAVPAQGRVDTISVAYPESFAP